MGADRPADQRLADPVGGGRQAPDRARALDHLFSQGGHHPFQPMVPIFQAPVWPGELYKILRYHAKLFPGKDILLIENGCVDATDGYDRSRYIESHIREVQRAYQKGVKVTGYDCWSITSNREWGLPFNRGSDFGLYHIELDSDPKLTRMPTPAVEVYKRIIERS